MDQTAIFEAERPRLVRVAARVLADHTEAEDVVQQAWLRLARTEVQVESLPAWLTTVTTRLCLDRLRARTPVPRASVAPTGTAPDPADDVALAETVGLALQVVLDRLSPRQRVAFVLHDSFGFEFTTIATLLGTTPPAARKLASRARTALAERPPATTPADGSAEAPADALPADALPADRLPADKAPAQDMLADRVPADREVVDAFMKAARQGDFDGLLRLLAPEVAVRADDAAVRAGTPARIDGQRAVAAFFDGSAQATLPVLLDHRPGAAWYHRGRARVAFDFLVVDGAVAQIAFRADPQTLARLSRRATPRHAPAPARVRSRSAATAVTPGPARALDDRTAPRPRSHEEERT